MQAQPKTFWEKAQAIDRRILYLLLMLAAVVSLFPQVIIPTKPQQPVKDLYRALIELPEGSTVVLQSDWTQSTRGESAGQMEALLRILMRRNIKFALLSVADPQAPRVAEDVIRRINLERESENQPPYRPWEDYVRLKYFPNAEATANSMASNIRATITNRKEVDTEGNMRDVWESPVLRNIRSIEDFSTYINVTGSKTSNILIERLGRRVEFIAMVTGVMGPETLNYYQSGQVRGVVIGLNGVAEIETLMARGLPASDIEDLRERGVLTGYSEVQMAQLTSGFEGKNLGRGMGYYLALHACLTLMILAVVLGNVAMVMTRRKR